VQIRIQANDEYYTNDERKVNLGSSYLAGKPKAQWDRHRKRFDAVTYADFEEFLKGTAGTAEARARKAGTLVHTLRQRESSFLAFYKRWTEVRALFPVSIPHIVSIYLFLPTLRPRLRAQIISLGVPATWYELRDVGLRAERLESLLNPQHQS
jgi:hypothetical protein